MPVRNSNGEFNFPSYELSTQEYAKIVSEINTNYRKYRGKPFAIHLSVGTDDNYYFYYFENHGFNNYNIVGKIGF